MARAVEAIVFAADEPVSLAEIGRHVAAPAADLRAVLTELAASYAPRGINLVERGPPPTSATCSPRRASSHAS